MGSGGEERGTKKMGEGEEQWCCCFDEFWAIFVVSVKEFVIAAHMESMTMVLVLNTKEWHKRASAVLVNRMRQDSWDQIPSACVI